MKDMKRRDRMERTAKARRKGKDYGCSCHRCVTQHKVWNYARPNVPRHIAIAFEMSAG